MREVKFRGKQIDNGVWVYGYLIGDDVIVGNIVEFNDEYFNTSFWYKVRPETVGQYTGLEDRNCKEIYESDVMDIGTRAKVIEWHDLSAQWAVKNPKTGIGQLDMNADLHEYEVIGNLFDNPELIT